MPSLRSRRSVAGILALAASLALAGCATPARGSESPKPEHGGAAPSTSSFADAVTDADTCLAIGEVVSVTFNADVAVGEGRMSTQEQGGWYRLASTVLARVPIRGEGPVSETVSALQSAVPPIPLAAADRTEIGSDEWHEQVAAVFNACEEAGSEVVTSAFTGG